MAQAGTVFLRGFEGDGLQFDNCHIAVNIRRRMTREVKRGGEGEDLYAAGAESAVYKMKGNLGILGNRTVVNMIRSDAL